jgi:Sortilin, neurotensin receptor 3,
VRKTGEDIDIKELENNIKTFITHNKGGKWELIKAPATDMDNRPIKCYVEDGCSLHL